MWMQLRPCTALISGVCSLQEQSVAKCSQGKSMPHELIPNTEFGLEQLPCKASLGTALAGCCCPLMQCMAVMAARKLMPCLSMTAFPFQAFCMFEPSRRTSSATLASGILASEHCSFLASGAPAKFNIAICDFMTLALQLTNLHRLPSCMWSDIGVHCPTHFCVDDDDDQHMQHPKSVFCRCNFNADCNA